MRLNARSSLMHGRDQIMEQAIQPVCIVCSRPTGEDRRRKESFIAVTNSSMTESHPEASGEVGSVAKVNLHFFEIQDMSDTVP